MAYIEPITLSNCIQGLGFREFQCRPHINKLAPLHRGYNTGPDITALKGVGGLHY